MSLRKLYLLSMVAALCLGRPAFSQTRYTTPVEVGEGAIAQVIIGKPPVVKVTDAEGKELASIPIGKISSFWIYSKLANSLYLIDRENKDVVSIIPINLTTQKVDKEIKIDANLDYYFLPKWFMSQDGNRFFFEAPGRSKPKTDPLIYVIDTASNKVTETYNYDWLRDFITDLPMHCQITNLLIVGGHCQIANQLIPDGDGRRLIVISAAYAARQLKPFKYQLTVLVEQSSRPLIKVDPGGRVVASMYSKDGKFLFAGVEGDKKTDGSLIVIDMEKGTTVTHALTDHPTRLFRLGSKNEPWILGSEEMRAFSETGELTDRRIPLNKPVKSEEGGETGASVFLNGIPGETLSLGNDYAAIQINNKDGGSLHKVALVDLKKLQVDAVIPTMSAGEIAGIRTSRFLGAMLLSALPGPVVFTPNLTMRNESLAARPDGRYLFALDLEGHVIMVVDVQTATVVRRIPVNGTVTKLQASSDGKHIICIGTKTQQINLETNELEK
jgi:hypothetical protein